MDVAVVGSLNLDTTVRVPRLPAPGETVLGAGRAIDTGGKGANQAVAAARLGRTTAMVGAVGPDPAGDLLIAALEDEGVETGAVLRSALPSGVAHITVDDAGENMIVVDPGANGALAPDDVAAAAEVIVEASVTLVQLEIPLPAVEQVAALASRLILNPAPARPLSPGLVTAAEVIVPNATELALLAGGPEPGTPTEAAEAAMLLPGAVVVTLGAEGAVVVDEGSWEHVPAPVVDAVDPTAAGDAFCGGLADALVGNASLLEAVRWAVRCGAVAATRPGAQASLPTREDVLALEV